MVLRHHNASSHYVINKNRNNNNDSKKHPKRGNNNVATKYNSSCKLKREDNRAKKKKPIRKLALTLVSSLLACSSIVIIGRDYNLYNQIIADITMLYNDDNNYNYNNIDDDNYNSNDNDDHDDNEIIDYDTIESHQLTIGKKVKNIEKVTMNSLHDLKREFRGEDPTKYDNVTFDEAVKGRERIWNVLQDAGIKEIDVQTLMNLPTWEEVQSTYFGRQNNNPDAPNSANNNGDHPIIYGLETCEQFRKSVPKEHAFIGVAGFYNTGTNAMKLYLKGNIKMPHNNFAIIPADNGNGIDDEISNGILGQVPWHKHWLPSYRFNNTAPPYVVGKQFEKFDSSNNRSHILPIVMVRDPYTWMQSMCQAPYDISWYHGKTNPCPNLVPQKPIPRSFFLKQEQGPAKDSFRTRRAPGSKQARGPRHAPFNRKVSGTRTEPLVNGMDKASYYEEYASMKGLLRSQESDSAAKQRAREYLQAAIKRRREGRQRHPNLNHRHLVEATPVRESENVFDPYKNRVKFNKLNRKRQWNSLVELYNEWYNEYANADFPRLIIRFEDLLFHAREVIHTIQECAGAIPLHEGSFTYVVDRSKYQQDKVKVQSNMISAIIKHTTIARRYGSMTEKDIQYTHDHIDMNLMKLFSYKIH